MLIRHTLIYQSIILSRLTYQDVENECAYVDPLISITSIYIYKL